jgi:hypothetical protein
MWLEGMYITLRPSFGDKEAIYAYCTEIAWDAAASWLAFREGERLDAAYTQYGEVAVPNQSGHIYLVTNRHGQASPDHGVASADIGRNVRHHHHPLGGARFAADADRRTDRVLADQNGAGAHIWTGLA